MKNPYLLPLTLLLSCAASAGTLDCTSGWQWLSLSGIEALENSGDQSAVAGCEWLAPLPAGRKSWPPGLPSLSYYRALPTEISDSKGYIRYEHWQADVPLLRMGSTIAGFRYQSDYRQQRHHLQDSMLLNGSTLLAGQTLLLSRDALQAGAYLDIRELESPFSALTLLYSRDERPLGVSLAGSPDELQTLTLSSWRVRLERYYLPAGLSMVGHFGLGEAEVSEQDGQASLTAATDGMLLVDVNIGVQWVYRSGPFLAFMKSHASLTHYHSSVSAEESGVASFTDLDYGASVGLGVRF